jgi:hypothetical protein
MMIRVLAAKARSVDTIETGFTRWILLFGTATTVLYGSVTDFITKDYIQGHLNVEKKCSVSLHQYLSDVKVNEPGLIGIDT